MKLKKWVRTAGKALAAGILAAACITALATSPETEIVEYHCTVDEGQSLWDVCAKVATDYDDLSELVYRTQVENHLTDKDLGALRPGMEIIIHPKRMVKP